MRSEKWRVAVGDSILGPICHGIRRHTGGRWLVPELAPEHVRRYLNLPEKRASPELRREGGEVRQIFGDARQFNEPGETMTPDDFAERRKWWGEIVTKHATGRRWQGHVVLLFDDVPRPSIEEAERRVASPLRVEHKWSLWSAHRETWNEQSGGAAFLASLDALPKGSAVGVALQSRKEIRAGYLIVTRAAARRFVARGSFTEEWDDEYGRFGDCPRADGGSPGVTVDVDVTAPTVDALLAAVDAREDVLINESRDEWRAFLRRHRHLAKQFGGLRAACGGA